MYAIIKTGGKQYRVAKGDVIDVELLDAEEGGEITFSDILFMHDGKEANIGGPFVSGGSVTGKVVGSVQGPKISSVKYKRSHNEWRKFGHRQPLMRIEITGVEFKEGKKASKEHKEHKAEHKAEHKEHKAEHKEHKAEHKASKEHKEHKEEKEHKEHKEHKEKKEAKEHKKHKGE